MTPEPRPEERWGSLSKRSPKKWRNTGSSKRGWRLLFTSLLVKI